MRGDEDRARSKTGEVPTRMRPLAQREEGQETRKQKGKYRQSFQAVTYTTRKIREGEVVDSFTEGGGKAPEEVFRLGTRSGARECETWRKSVPEGHSAKGLW